MTALMQASACGQLEIVRLLLEARAAKHITGQNGKTAVMLASEHGHLEVAHLLEAGV